MSDLLDLLRDARRISPFRFYTALAALPPAAVMFVAQEWLVGLIFLATALVNISWVASDVLIEGYRGLVTTLSEQNASLRRENRALRSLLDLTRDTGSADARLLTAVALTAGALWLAYLAPVLAALVLLPAAVVSAVVLVLLLRADRRDRATRDRDVVRSLARPLPPLTREQREAWERIRGEGL